MKSPQFLLRKFFIVGFALALVVFFQNCSAQLSSSVSSAGAGGNNTNSSGANRPPEAKNLDMQAFELVQVKQFLPGLDADSDPLEFTLLTNPQYGFISDFNAMTGEFSYKANLGALATDSFTYQVSDGKTNAVQAGVVSLQITDFSFIGSDRVYKTTQVLNNGSSCGSYGFRAYVLGNSLFIDSRTASCGNTTLRMNAVSATIDAQKNVLLNGIRVGTISDTQIQVRLSKSVSGCTNVTNTFTLKILNGKINYTEIITASCGTSGTYNYTLTSDMNPDQTVVDLIPDKYYFDLGMITKGSQTDQVIQATNKSGGKAYDLSMQLSAATAFKGGTFPGVGGTCTATLESLATCTIVLSVGSGTSTEVNESVLLKYSDGVNVQTKSIQFVAMIKPVLQNPTQLSANGSLLGCVLDQGKVSCWGSNQYGAATVPDLTNPTTVAVDNNMGCSTSDGKIKCWGDNYFLNSRNGVAALAIATNGSNRACSYDSTSVMCWGVSITSTSALVTQIPAVTSPRQIVIGSGHACVLDDNTVKCWGDNPYGQATVPALTNPTQISAGTHHTCALDSGVVKCWGNNTYNVTTVPTLTNPKIITSNMQHNCVADDNGVKCWGDPVGARPVPTLSQVTHLSTGPHGTCAIANKELYCW